MNSTNIPYDIVSFSPEAPTIQDKLLDANYTYPEFSSNMAFHNHTYLSCYDPIRGIFITYLISRNYVCFFTLKAEELGNLSSNPRKIFSVGYRLVLASIYSLKKRNTYEIALDNLKDRLETTKNRIVLPWRTYALRKYNTAFNILNLEFKNISDIPHLTFRHDGGIIETNSISHVLNILNGDGITLVVHPRYATGYWATLSQKFKLILVNYHDLVMKIVTDKKSKTKSRINLSNSESNKFDSAYYTGLTNRKNINDKIQEVIDACSIKDVSSIVLHECHIKILPLLKQFVKQVTKLNKIPIWIVNSLPIGYYFNTGSTNRTGVSINQLEAVINLWGNFTNLQRRMYKISIGKNIVADFSDFYSVVRTPMLYRSIEISRTSFVATPLEMQIYNLYTTMFNTMFSFDKGEEHKVPCITLNSMLLIQRRIINAVLVLSASTVSRDDLKNRVITSLTNNANSLPRKTSQREGLNKSLQKWTHRVPNLPNDTTCPICFETDVVWIFTFCGHSLCLNCLISTLADRNSCPICRCRLTLRSCVVDEQSAKASVSYVEPLWAVRLRQLNDQSVIITDMNIDKNMTGARVFRTKERDVEKLLKLINIHRVIVFVSPEPFFMDKSEERKTNRVVEAFLDHFTLYDKPPVVEIWNYVIS